MAPDMPDNGVAGQNLGSTARDMRCGAIGGAAMSVPLPPNEPGFPPPEEPGIEIPPGDRPVPDLPPPEFPGPDDPGYRAPSPDEILPSQ